MNGEAWSEDELSTLRTLYADSEKIDLLNLLPNRTWSSIRQRAYKDGIIRTDAPAAENDFSYTTNNLDIAYLLGIYLTDGFTTKNHNRTRRLGLTVLDKSIQNRFQDAGSGLFGKRNSIFTNNEKYWSSWIYSIQLCNWLNTVTQDKKWLPDFVYTESVEWQKEFLAGLIDGDGWATFSPNRYKTKDGKPTETWYCQIGLVGLLDSYMTGVPRLLDMLRVEHSGLKKRAPRKDGYQWQAVILIRPKSFLENGLYFHCERKASKVEGFSKYISQ